MNEQLKTILDFIQQNENLTADEKDTFSKAVKDVDKELAITAFKLDRTEKVKRTTAILLEETIEELEQKRKAVEAQNRELEIESSLERVRSVAMGMQNPAEMVDVCKIISEQLEFLKVKDIRNVQTAVIYESKGTYINYEYYARHNKLLTTEVSYKTHHLQEQFANQMLKGAGEFFSPSLEGQQVKDWYEYQKTTNQFADSFLEGAQTLNYYMFSLGPVALGISTYSPLKEEEINLFNRFRNVFELAYRRFTDIQKAEAQAHEAQIEAALERVRSRTMAMQRSEELGEAASLLFKQINELGIKVMTAGFNIWSADNSSMTSWMTDPAGSFLPPYNVPLNEFWLPKSLNNAKQLKEEFLEIQLNSAQLKENFNYLAKLPELKAILGSMDLSKFQLPETQVDNYAFFSLGNLMFITFEPCPDAHDIFKRFAKVFEQTYTRFLDLQKAEAQAKEAHIQLALERVRARTMAMQHSNELGEVSFILNKQIVDLGIPTRGCAFNIYGENESTEWFSNLDGTIPTYKTPRENIFLKYYQAGQRGETLLIEEFGGERIRQHYKYLMSLQMLGNTEKEEEEEILKVMPERQIDHVAYFKFGYLLFITLVPAHEAHEVFKRFAKEFEQTYTRFLDLQKAELQAKEAIKASSLDRVRGEIASMRTVDDLQRITPIIWHELIALGVPFVRCGVFIIEDSKEHIQVHLSSPDGSSLGLLDLPFNSSELTTNSVNHWRQGIIFKTHWGKQEFLDFMQSMIKEGQVLNPETYQGAAAPPESLDLHFVPFKQGMLYVGNSSPLEIDELQLVKSLAESFSIAYARYEDFRQLEEAKNQIEKTFTELKATQSQLIQAEKMASLGELTAGIAHEIQNPLNFVNNFAEVSNELIDEMNEELAVGNMQLAREIAEDIKQNLEKINHHGKRADAIVKGMLQHSRTSTGIKEPTDINALADEYLRLAYHGLRAKDKSFNATMVTDFDETLGKINIIPQDIGRVILNLITNAFYAVTAPHKAPPPPEVGTKESASDFKPTVTVRTSSFLPPTGGMRGAETRGAWVSISVSDNGPGIPPEVVDKIFQPFFTTKPSGQGTGLGLSMSYEIVTKGHGGELKVENKPGEGATFTIVLPG